MVQFCPWYQIESIYLPVCFYSPAQASCFWGSVSTGKRVTGVTGTFPLHSSTGCPSTVSLPHPQPGIAVTLLKHPSDFSASESQPHVLFACAEALGVPTGFLRQKMICVGNRLWHEIDVTFRPVLCCGCTCKRGKVPFRVYYFWISTHSLCLLNDKLVIKYFSWFLFNKILIC